MLTGQNGILNRAQEAKEKTEISKQDESDKLSLMEAMVQTAGTKVTNPSSYGENPNAQAIADGAGKYFALPDGAKYLEGTVDTGVVVEIKGSEFVWVPVDDVVLDTNRTSELPTSEDNGTANGKTYTPLAVKVGNDYKGLLYNFNGMNSYLMYGSKENYQGDVTGNREPDVINEYDGSNNDTTIEKITLTKLTSEYNAMITSVLKYKGFYVARYEAGLDKTTNVIVFKNSNIEENNVLTADASNNQTSSWYGLYQKIKTFSADSDKIVSSMIWGSQYDAIMNWMSKTGNAVGTNNASICNNETITGYNKMDVINNIYDLYGCHFEWTIETARYYNEDGSYTDNRVERGGYSSYSYAPSNRIYNSPLSQNAYHSSRATLYIK